MRQRTVQYILDQSATTSTKEGASRAEEPSTLQKPRLGDSFRDSSVESDVIFLDSKLRRVPRVNYADMDVIDVSSDVDSTFRPFERSRREMDDSGDQNIRTKHIKRSRSETEESDEQTIRIKFIKREPGFENASEEDSCTQDFWALPQDSFCRSHFPGSGVTGCVQMPATAATGIDEQQARAGEFSPLEMENANLPSGFDVDMVRPDDHLSPQRSGSTPATPSVLPHALRNDPASLSGTGGIRAPTSASPDVNDSSFGQSSSTSSDHFAGKATTKQSAAAMSKILVPFYVSNANSRAPQHLDRKGCQPNVPAGTREAVRRKRSPSTTSQPPPVLRISLPDDQARATELLCPSLTAAQWMIVKCAMEQAVVNLDMWRPPCNKASQRELSAKKFRSPESLMQEAQEANGVKGEPMARKRLLALYGSGKLNIVGRMSKSEDLDKKNRCVCCAQERRDCFRVEPDAFYQGPGCPQCILNGNHCSFMDVLSSVCF